jgi:hypothetical protein
VRQAALDVILEQQQGHLVRRGGQRLDLLQHVQAVRLLADQSLQATRLPLDPLQPVHEEAPILGVRVAKVLWLHTAGEYARHAWHRSIGRPTAPFGSG